MKRERRHELQDNALADWLGSQIEQVKPYWQVIVGTILAAVVVYFGLSWYGSRNQQEAALAWTEYFDALAQNDGEALSDIAVRNADSNVGLWAMQSQGDIHLITGAPALFRDRDQARDELTKARTVYTNLLGQLGDRSDPLLRQRAMYGLAQSHEGLDSIVKAVQQYEELAKEFPDSPFGKPAKRKQEELGKTSVRDLCSWFAKQTPRPAQRIPPGSADRPKTSLDDLPDMPDLSLPGEDDLGRPLEPLESFLDEPLSTDDPSDDTGADDATEEPPAESTDTAPEEMTEQPAESTEEQPVESTEEQPTEDAGDASETDEPAETPAESP